MLKQLTNKFAPIEQEIVPVPLPPFADGTYVSPGVLVGTSGDDFLFARSGDTVGAGAGDDVIISSSDNIIQAGAGNDVVGVYGNDVFVSADGGNDTISVGLSATALPGVALGNNRVDNATIQAGSGNDTIRLNNVDDVNVSLGLGADTVEFTDESNADVTITDFSAQDQFVFNKFSDTGSIGDALQEAALNIEFAAALAGAQFKQFITRSDDLVIDFQGTTITLEDYSGPVDIDISVL